MINNVEKKLKAENFTIHFNGIAGHWNGTNILCGIFKRISITCSIIYFVSFELNCVNYVVYEKSGSNSMRFSVCVVYINQ